MSGLTLAEANDAQRLRANFDAVAKAHGAGTAKHVRAIVSSTLEDAVAMRALPTNEVRQVRGIAKVEPKRGKDRDTSRALTEDEMDNLLGLADRRIETLSRSAGVRPKERSTLEAVADLVWFLSGTGVRRGEALLVRWDDLDLETGRLEVRGTKTAASRRTLNLPAWLLQRLRERGERVGTQGLIFPAPTAQDPERRWEERNVSREIRDLFDAAGIGWCSTHVFRKTVVTKLLDAAVPVNRVADQVGHANPATTLRHYAGRDLKGDKSDLAALL